MWFPGCPGEAAARAPDVTTRDHSEPHAVESRMGPMSRLWTYLSVLATGGSSRVASKPLIAGYRRTTPPWVTAIAMSVLGIALFVYGFFFAVNAPARMMPFTIPIAVLLLLVIW